MRGDSAARAAPRRLYPPKPQAVWGGGWPCGGAGSRPPPVRGRAKSLGSRSVPVRKPKPVRRWGRPSKLLGWAHKPLGARWAAFVGEAGIILGCRGRGSLGRFSIPKISSGLAARRRCYWPTPRTKMDSDSIFLENSLPETAVFLEPIMVFGKFITYSPNCMHCQFTLLLTCDATLTFKFKELFHTVAR